MTKTEYLAKLDKYLRRLPREDYLEAMDYFTEYFDEAGPDNEAKVIAELGNPKEAASDIIYNILGKRMVEIKERPHHPAQMLWIAILAIFAAPLALPLLLALLGVLVAMIAVSVAVIITLLLLGIAFIMNSLYLIYEGFTLLSTSLATAVLSLGTGLLIFGLSLLILLAVFEITQLLVYASMSIIQWGIARGKKA